MEGRPNCIQTVSGVFVDVINPGFNEYLIQDIAHALANTPRWGGHTRGPAFSVAQHSTMVADFCLSRGRPAVEQLQALLHDATEAYMADVPKPLKVHLPRYVELEDALQKDIFAAYGLPLTMSGVVKAGDVEAYRWEHHHFLGCDAAIQEPTGWFANQPPVVYTPRDAEERFLYVYQCLRQIREEDVV